MTHCRLFKAVMATLPDIENEKYKKSNQLDKENEDEESKENENNKNESQENRLKR